MTEEVKQRNLTSPGISSLEELEESHFELKPQKPEIEIFEPDDKIIPTIWYTSSQYATCSNCQETDHTKVEKRIGISTFILSCCFFCMGGCCFLPFFVKSLKDTHHLCKHCNTELGVRTFL
mmetsp:Transcript_15404/g.22364  ORF Transcript_15404/g.22364 Transcript_15404/m.22364 type:complete len:121 (+) Transcript_15404:634-996(+)